LLSLQYLSERPPSRQLDSTVFLSIIGYSASLVSRMTDSSRSHSIVPNLDHVVLRTSPSASHSNTLNLKTFDIAEIAEVGYTPHLVPQHPHCLPLYRYARSRTTWRTSPRTQTHRYRGFVSGTRRSHLAKHHYRARQPQ
jgi:hypothetical protein